MKLEYRSSEYHVWYTDHANNESFIRIEEIDTLIDKLQAMKLELEAKTAAGFDYESSEEE